MDLSDSPPLYFSDEEEEDQYEQRGAVQVRTDFIGDEEEVVESDLSLSLSSFSIPLSPSRSASSSLSQATTQGELSQDDRLLRDTRLRNLSHSSDEDEDVGERLTQDSQDPFLVFDRPRSGPAPGFYRPPPRPRRPSEPRADTGDESLGPLDAEDEDENSSFVAPSLHPSSSSSSSAIPETTQMRFIWGTKIDLYETVEKLEKFLVGFRREPGERELYPRLLSQLIRAEVWHLNVDAHHLFSWDPTLYSHLVRYPQEMVTLFDLTVEKVVQTLGLLPPDSPQRLQVRPFHLEASERKKMRELNPEDIDTMVSLHGMVTRQSPILPDLRQAMFRCQMCAAETRVNIDRGRISEPSHCESCAVRGSMQILHNRCDFANKQLVRLQETPDSIPEGETPQTVSLCVYDDLVDVCRPGDRVEVTGIYRAQPIQMSNKSRRLRSIYRTYIDVIHFRRTEKGQAFSENEPVSSRSVSSQTEEEQQPMTSTLEDTEIESLQSDEHLMNEGMFDAEGTEAASDREERERKLRAMASEGDIVEKLTRALAPSIWELEDVKRGILCLLFGGTNKRFSQSGEGRFRGEINVLLCGDPGTSKSQLLQYVHKIAPRGLYTSGRGSSAVGLTAYVTKDPDTGQHVLESGALVLSDRGVCCIDEFDKMTDFTRSILHEAMEQQTVSIAKAGIICTLNARTSILASANPRESRYNPQMSVVDNIDLPPTLLSRFDLIYLILDKPNPTTDGRLAQHLVSLYFHDAIHRRPPVDVETLTQYISYARRKVQPLISDEAKEKLVEGYVEMRRGGGNRRTISATPRQLESLIRLSEAHARMRLSSTVTPDDVEEAVRLMKVAIQQAAIDPKTGTVDMDLIFTGRSASSRTRQTETLKKLREFLAKTGPIKADQIIEALARPENGAMVVAKDEMRDALHVLEQEGTITLSGDIRNRTVRLALLGFS